MWWRRSGAFGIPDEVAIAADRRFASNECAALIEGWLHSLGSSVINPVAAENAAQRKPFQLHRAARNGLRVPRTLITNCETAADEFLNLDSQKFINKPLTAMRDGAPIFTRLVDQHVKARLHLLNAGPSIFQQAISGGFDIRVTVIDGLLFSAELLAGHPEAKFDWRLDPQVKTRFHQLPPDVEACLRSLHSDLGLRYGAYDFRCDDRGDYYFLEVNVGGQFLWVETDTDQPISRAIANALLTPSHSNQNEDCR